MLAIEVAFLTGRYIATAYHSRTSAEWPPHPARLFSALVATHAAAETSDVPAHVAERAALEWLECLGAPHLYASDASARDVVTVFVPVNDVGLTDVDEQATAVDVAKQQLQGIEQAGDSRAVKKAQRELEKREASLRKATAAATAVTRSHFDPDRGRRVLPEFRGRQPRTFPSVTPAEPRVVFIWPDAEPSGEYRASLAGLLRRVIRLGHSSSLVSMRLLNEAPAPTWCPGEEGEETLRIVQGGQLQALETAWSRHREEEPRVMPSVPQPYSRPRSASIDYPVTTLFAESWLVLRRVYGPQLPMASTAGVARAVRRALLSHADEPIPEILSGHVTDGLPTQRPHLALVPLPFVGHARATGAVLGIALILPREAGDSDKKAVFAAMAKWEESFRQEDEDTPAIHVNLGDAGVLGLERVEAISVQASLRPVTWCAAATQWSSVTPVALDRNPGNLSSRDRVEQLEALREAEASICQACARIGLPEPVQVEILPAARWAGAAKARQYPPYPGLEGRTQRVLTHVRLTFSQAVRGPVLLGAGRFVGLGLFRPEVA